MESFSMVQAGRWLFGAISICCFAATVTAAEAQTTEPTPSQKPNSQKPGGPAKQSGDVPLSKKLDRNDGVIKPPHGIDPEIHQAPPARTGDKMPVIIPPGEPGGDQSVQPK
ncbi:hypothetical protein [Hyphomicrobium sp. MC8b]|uniref:hypothetical protein n=1 Tax=Hyphomicrobium sp. MC8b TaxID=300273 RepID=UPI0039198965